MAQTEKENRFLLLEGIDKVGPLLATDFYELSPKQKQVYRNRLLPSQAELKSYLTLEAEDVFDATGLGLIPPLHGSVVYSVHNKFSGSAYPYVFMSRDFRLAEIAFEFFEDRAAVRSIRLIPSSDEFSHRTFFIGFFSISAATQFFMDIAWDSAISHEVFFNGHKLMCGSEVYAHYDNVV